MAVTPTAPVQHFASIIRYCGASHCQMADSWNCVMTKKVRIYITSQIWGSFSWAAMQSHTLIKTINARSGLTEQIPSEVNELFDTGSTIGAYIIFPNNRIDGKHTINQARGVNSLIDDRFDLTLECIRRFYLQEKSPLYDTLVRYKGFFDLFDDFLGYIHFFLLDDLITKNEMIDFYLPFDGFATRPTFTDVNQYLLYKNRVVGFINSRNKRIDNYVNEMKK